METKRVVFLKGFKTNLCILDERDAEVLVHFVNDSENLHFLKRVGPITLDTEREWVKSIAKKAPNDYVFGISNKDTDELIGVIGLHRIDYVNRTASTGTLIGKSDMQSKGFGTDAKMVLLKWAFETLNLRKIYSKVWEYNTRSLAYADKCGYVVEARLKEHAFKNGSYVDEIILSLYREPWQRAYDAYVKFAQK